MITEFVGPSIQSLPSAVPFSILLERRKIKTLPKTGKNPKSAQNSRPNSLLSKIGKLFEEVILKTVQKHTGERGLLNARQSSFRARHSMTLQRMRLTDVTLNFNNKMSTAAVFLVIEKVIDTTWLSGLLYKLPKLGFSASLIQLTGSFLSQREFRVSVEGEMSTPRVMQARLPQGSVLSPTLSNMCICRMLV
jgi:hypothetical protein